MPGLLARVERRAARLAKWLPPVGLHGWVLTLAAWKRAQEEGEDLCSVEQHEVEQHPTHSGPIKRAFERIRERRAEADQTLSDFEGDE